jgi:hypothetical protein
MMSSAIASGSENSFGISCRPGHSWGANRPESDASQRSYSVFTAELRL